jgi:hypothetical protein
MDFGFKGRAHIYEGKRTGTGFDPTACIHVPEPQEVMPRGAPRGLERGGMAVAALVLVKMRQFRRGY